MFPIATGHSMTYRPPNVDKFDPAGFWDQVDRSGPCWVWLGRRSSNGYGLLGHTALSERFVHRLSWVIANGAIPGGSWVLHRCDNRPCVNPDHLYLGTASDNARDREARGRGNHPTRETHPHLGYPGIPHVPHVQCRRGHELTADNRLLFKDGWQRCRRCYMERVARRRAVA